MVSLALLKQQQNRTANVFEPNFFGSLTCYSGSAFNYETAKTWVHYPNFKFRGFSKFSFYRFL